MCLAPHPCTVVQQGRNAANSLVLGMVATGMDACDNAPCSTSLHSMIVQKGKNDGRFMQDRAHAAIQQSDGISNSAVSTSVLRMVATGMVSCDNVSCSTYLRSMLYKGTKLCRYLCFGHGRNMNMTLLSPLHSNRKNTETCTIDLSAGRVAGAVTCNDYCSNSSNNNSSNNLSSNNKSKNTNNINDKDKDHMTMTAMTAMTMTSVTTMISHDYEERNPFTKCVYVYVYYTSSFRRNYRSAHFLF